MAGQLQDLAEALLSEATLVLFQAFGADNFPEFYVQDLARTPMVLRLHRRRYWDRLAYRLERAKRVTPIEEPSETPAVEALAPLDSSRAEEAYYRRQQALVENLLEKAVDVLFEGGDEFAWTYIDLHAQEHMARCLRQFRERQSPSERDAFVAETNWLRALAGQPPDTWVNIVTVVPKRPLVATR
jgi:hypothetical protein